MRKMIGWNFVANDTWESAGRKMKDRLQHCTNQLRLKEWSEQVDERKRKAVEFPNRTCVKIFHQHVDVVVLHAAISINSHVHAGTRLFLTEDSPFPPCLERSSTRSRRLIKSGIGSRMRAAAGCKHTRPRLCRAGCVSCATSENRGHLAFSNLAPLQTDRQTQCALALARSQIVRQMAGHQIH